MESGGGTIAYDPADGGGGGPSRAVLDGFDADALLHVTQQVRT
ncbi:hypothetical protein ABZ702_01400 [Streptomyces cyaneofuscatus]